MDAAARRRNHKAALRQEILEVAREIFVREGYESFSMRKLAQRIDYSPASIYLHFKSKEKIFESLVQESFERLLEVLLRVKDDRHEDPIVLLKRALHTYVAFGLRNPSDYRFAFLLRRPLQKRPYQVHPVFDVMRHLVRRCVEERRFRRVDIERTSQALWAPIHGITSLLIQRPTFPWVAKRELINQVIDSAVDGLLATPQQTGRRTAT